MSKRSEAAMAAMLDRIARAVSDRFDPRSEECIADGVDSLADELGEKPRTYIMTQVSSGWNGPRDALLAGRGPEQVK